MSRLKEGPWFHATELRDSRAVSVAAPPPDAFQPIVRIGGATGWYFGNWLWWLRGVLDRMVGGVGLRRGRRDAEQLREGDKLDCWRVESFEPDRRLRLAAEMKLPGDGWLEFEVNGNGACSVIRQTAIFHPRGLLGVAYWYMLWPIHHVVFAGMLREIAARSCRPAPVRPDRGAGS